jgi:hypothetical protein
VSWRLALALVCALAACKPDEIPFVPPPPEDAASAAPDDAAAPVALDAAAAETPTARKVVVGDHASCAVMSDTSVRCWGKNSDGQLGDGTTDDAATPVSLKLRGVTDLVMGTAHACALLDDNSVTCWGRINFGRRERLLVPTAVPGLARARRVFAVKTASCATLADGSLVCWGDVDARGRLRLSGGTQEYRVPTPSQGLANVIALTANGALHEDGSVSWWSADGVPRRSELSNVVEIASSGDGVCGLRRDGTVACVGPTTRCASAAPRPAPRRRGGKRPPSPEPTSTVEILRLPGAKRLAFDVGLCVVTTTGRLQCLAPGDSCRADEPWPGLAGVAGVSGNCARISDGSVRCWTVDKGSRVVVRIPGVADAIALAGSSSHACAHISTGAVFCWGSNRSGALGRRGFDDRVSGEAAPVAF